MTAEEAVYTRILAIAAVTAIVGDRVYLHQLPQSIGYPCVLVTLASQPEPGYHLRGGAGLAWSRVQVDALAQKESGVDAATQASDLADAIQGDDAGSGLSGFKGTVGGSPPTSIAGCFLMERTRGFDPDELQVFNDSRDYRVWVRTAA